MEHDIQHALDHIYEWAAPTAVGTNLVNALGLGTSEIAHEPLGVVCIHGAWNYPFILALQPMVGAIASGNCVLLKAPSPKYSKNCAEALMRLCNSYFDTSCIRVIGGERAVTQSLFKCRFDHAFLTGSADSGKRLARACAEHLTCAAVRSCGRAVVQWCRYRL